MNVWYENFSLFFYFLKISINLNLDIQFNNYFKLCIVYIYKYELKFYILRLYLYVCMLIHTCLSCAMWTPNCDKLPSPCGLSDRKCGFCDSLIAACHHQYVIRSNCRLGLSHIQQLAICAGREDSSSWPKPVSRKLDTFCSRFCSACADLLCRINLRNCHVVWIEKTRKKLNIPEDRHVL